MVDKARKTRGESFLGIHFDFHAGEDCTEIGASVTPEMVGYILDRVKPDYVQTDCKGHRGLSSYPTVVGNRAPGFVKDTLRIWRDATAERGVALYLHYSGVWDDEAIRHHPDWARIDENGNPDPKNTSVFGPYVDELLIPQLRELAGDYGVDGVWIDGECWATCQDYSPRVLDMFEEATGITLDRANPPKAMGDPWFHEFTEFCREGFRKYLKHYVDELHWSHPEFQIASNWAYSSFMPEPVGVDVDFISGDYTLIDSLNSARLEGRFMMRQGKPWDLMAWAFASRWEDKCRSTKSVAQLRQEAAAVLSLGGGFQAYFTQKRDGGVRLWQMELMAKTAEFCREREGICHKAVSIPGASVALLLSTHAFYRGNKRLFSPWSGELDALKGVLQALLESQFHVEVVAEHHLKGRMHEYPVIINPGWDTLSDAFRDELLGYVRDGGNLIGIGPGAMSLFQEESGIAVRQGSGGDVSRWVASDGWLGGLQTREAVILMDDGVEVMGYMHTDNDPESPREAAASIAPYGRGQLGSIHFDLGKAYLNAATQVPRGLLARMVRRMVPKPMVEVKGSQYVDVTVMAKGDRLMVNLVNTAGPHANDKVYVFDDIPSVGPLEVTVRLPGSPSSVTLEPCRMPVAYSWEDGLLRVTVPSIAIHEVLVVKYR